MSACLSARVSMNTGIFPPPFYTSRHAHFIIRGSARQGQAEQRGDPGRGLSDRRETLSAPTFSQLLLSPATPPPRTLCLTFPGASPQPMSESPFPLGFFHHLSCRLGQRESQGQPETKQRLRGSSRWGSLGAAATHVQMDSLISRALHPLRERGWPSVGKEKPIRQGEGLCRAHMRSLAGARGTWRIYHYRKALGVSPRLPCHWEPSV